MKLLLIIQRQSEKAIAQNVAYSLELVRACPNEREGEKEREREGREGERDGGEERILIYA